MNDVRSGYCWIAERGLKCYAILERLKEGCRGRSNGHVLMKIRTTNMYCHHTSPAYLASEQVKHQGSDVA